MAPKSTSLIWNHFEKENSNLATCKICRKKLLTKNSNTKGLWTHLLKSTLSEVLEIISSNKEEMESFSITNDCWTSRSNWSSEVLNWWRNHKTMLPLLSKLARKYLGIPATSTQSERVFSAGGRVCSSSRTSLETGKVESLVIINKNKKLLKEYNQIRK